MANILLNIYKNMKYMKKLHYDIRYKINLLKNYVLMSFQYKFVRKIFYCYHKNYL